MQLPEGRYFSCAFRVNTDAGGQTRALLMRNRIFAERGGVRPDLLTFTALADYPQRRAILREQGLLVDGMRLLNIYEHYREHGWRMSEPTGEPLDDLAADLQRVDTTPEGEPWRNVYRVPGSGRRMYDYLRPDGTPFIRVPSFDPARKGSWPDRLLALGPSGAVVGAFDSPGQFYRRWIRELIGDAERAFVFVDSRFVIPHIVPPRDRRIHLLYLMHNTHLLPPRRWDSRMEQVYRRVLRRIGGMDAMVTLTERQRDDISRRRGRTSNMFVIPNPVVMPEPPPGPPARDPRRVTIIARLSPQKQLDQAVAAFRQVVDALPDARLDIYGDGKERELVAGAIAAHGLQGSVTMRGFDPRATDALWTSSAFVMTSSFEGYPLSTLESMSRGCPVVSYDIGYGPREQITDGVDGFLVRDGDVDAVAARVIELLRSPELVERMGKAAIERVARYGPAEFLERWDAIVRAAIELKPARTRLRAVAVEDLRARRSPLGGVTIAGKLRVDGRSRRSELGSASLELAAVDDASGAVTALPLDTALERDGRFTLRAKVPRKPPGEDTWLRLRLTWENSSWQTEVARYREGELRVTRKRDAG